jgi:transposase
VIPLLDAVTQDAGHAGRLRCRPDALLADRGYHNDKYRRLIWRRGAKPVIARRQTKYGSDLGR